MPPSPSVEIYHSSAVPQSLVHVCDLLGILIATFSPLLCRIFLVNVL